MICLTYDTDHMTPRDMEQFFNEVDIPGRGTFFLWKPFPDFDWGRHEFEPHPHYEDVTQPEKHLVDYAAEIGMPFGTDKAPVGMRTHSCITSHMISLAAKDAGFKYTSMTMRLGEDGIKPYREPWGVWEMPIFYMDNMDYCTTENWPELNHKPFSDEYIEQAVNGSDLYIFDFHPLHLALNTPNMSYYQEIKHNVVGGAGNPFDHSYQGEGTRTFYEKLLKAMKAENLESVSLQEIIPAD